MRELKKRFKKLKMIQANTIELWDISTESQKKYLCVLKTKIGTEVETR